MIWCYLYVMWICFFAKSIPFACFIIFHWNLFLNIFRKHLYWQWLQGCCLTFFSFFFPIRYYVIRISIDATQKFSNFFLFFRRTLLHSVQIRFEYYISIGMACAFFLHFIAEEAVENVTFPLKIPSQNEQHFSINFMRFSTVCLQFYNFFFFSIEITR